MEICIVGGTVMTLAAVALPEVASVVLSPLCFSFLLPFRDPLSLHTPD